MSQQLPFLEIKGPMGEEFTFALAQDHITVGRFADHNDIGLEPDPQQLVSRRIHFYIEREGRHLVGC